MADRKKQFDGLEEPYKDRLHAILDGHDVVSVLEEIAQYAHDNMALSQGIRIHQWGMTEEIIDSAITKVYKVFEIDV